jgi:glycosyltransferase involved in cell wall biosynthesis
VLRGGRSLRDVEIVHLHGFNPALAYTCLASRRPIVFTEHGNFALGRRLGRRERFKRRLQRRFLERRASAVVANSRHTAVRISELYGIPSQRIETVHNGTSFPDLRPSEHPENGQLRIVFLGRLVPFKRVDRLLEGVARSTRRDRLRLDIIGSGPLERDLKAMAESLGLGDRIRFLGQRMDVHELVAKADVIVQPSEGEPFGLSILEGCAHGALPIVFADGGGALEVIPRDAVTVESIDHLARALDELADFPTALDLAARRRRVEWVRKRFAISVSARRYLAVYERAVAGR